MISSRRGVWVALCGIVGLLGLAGACTNSDDLGSGVDRMLIDIQLQNATTRFGVAGLSFSQITVRPVDPTANQVLGPQPLALVASTTGGTDVDFNGGSTAFELGTTLPAGTYRIESIVFEELLFQAGTPSATPMNCVGSVANYPEVSRVAFFNVGQEIRFDVTEGSDRNRLRVVIDGVTLANAFEQSWNCGCQIGPTCLPIGSCGGTRCTLGFRDGDFANQASTFLQVQPNP